MPSLKLKVNFTKGWPSKSIVEEVLQPDTGVLVEAGFIGRRTTTNKWALGITALTQEPFIFRNDYDDPDAGRSAPDSDTVAVKFGGIQGISFQNPLEVETTQYSGNPAVGDLLYAHTDGLLKIAVNAAGTLVTASKVVLCVVTKAGFYIGQSKFIRVSPIQRYVSPAS